MKFTAVLSRQHIGRYFKKHWELQGKRKIPEDIARKLLEEQGAIVYQPEDIYKEKKVFERVEIVGFKPSRVKFDQSHPNWHDTTLLTYKDNNVLLEGLSQAKVLTKCIQLQDGLPEDYIFNPLPKELNKQIKNIILSSHIFDAEQEKLPIRKDPQRPAWNFPRDYGVTYERRNKLMTSKLLHLLDSNGDHDIVKERYILNDLLFSFPFVKETDLIQLQLTGDALVISKKPLSPVTSVSTENFELPNLHPIKYSVTLNEENIYEVQDIYPIRKEMSARHPHTVFIHFDSTKVRNIYEEEVTEDQIYGRSLMKTFTVAASYAKQQFGADVKDLPHPVTVQCVQTDARLFHFGVLQLNTLDLENGPTKNIWYQTERLPLFERCEYESGRPVLAGYNDEVLKHLISFYNRT